MKSQIQTNPFTKAWIMCRRIDILQALLDHCDCKECRNVWILFIENSNKYIPFIDEKQLVVEIRRI